MNRLTFGAVFALGITATWVTAWRAETPLVSVFADRLLSYRETTPSEKTRVFLFAGGTDSANFAQEIVDQRKTWLQAGFREDEIACYYVRPAQWDFAADEDQYHRLAPELARCHLASVRNLREHLAIVARGKPEYLYLYFSSHGKQPLSLELEGMKDEDVTVRMEWSRYPTRFPIYEEYRIVVDSLPDGEASEGELLGAYRSGHDPRDLFLTPGNLHELLARYFARTEKIVVLQGCFSGGFLEDPRAERSNSLLSALERIHLLTAARFDRVSFGCDPGDRTTVFGEIYNRALTASLGPDPRRVDWAALAERVRRDVALEEERLDVEEFSEPQYLRR